MQILYVVLAVLGLSFLVFIHELGHYLVAKWVGMRVEAFSIGFGRPIVSWMRDGVKWQIGILPFGGFVKIAGMESEKGKEPHEIQDGFFGKSPWSRIQVALAGPLVNIAFALLVFAGIWALGGRMKPFSEYTNIIGFVDPQSELYEKGVRPGDQISTYNGEPYYRYQDILLASVSNAKKIAISGEKRVYSLGEKTPFSYTLPVYDDPRFPGGDLKTIGVLAPAKYLVVEGDISPESPLFGSGIEVGDRIVWADGEYVFSMKQLSYLINQQMALLSVERDGKRLQIRVPRVAIQELSHSDFAQQNLADWKFEARSQDSSFFIPYELSQKGVVIAPIPLQKQPTVDMTLDSEQWETPTELQSGDRIVAVDGKSVDSGAQVFRLLQKKRVPLIVDRGEKLANVSLAKANQEYIDTVDWSGAATLVSSIGSSSALQSEGTAHLLQPVEPVPMSEYPFSKADAARYTQMLDAMTAQAQKESNPEIRSQMLEEIAQQKNVLVLGASLSDAAVRVNRNPFVMMGMVVQDMGKTLASVTSGQVSAKWMSGPVGIMQMMHVSWSKGVEEAMYWLAVISVNLGVLNLLPLPVLDGGHIMISLYEMVTRKRISAKTMQRLIIPFAVFLILFFIYVTYNDIMRLL